MHDSEEIDSLKDAIAGRVMLPGDKGFEDLLSIDNGRIRRTPAIVVQPDCAEDVATAVGFAKRHRLPLTCKGGGHSYAGYCLNDHGLVVDLSKMKRMSLDRDEKTLTVQTGALWLDVYSYLKDSATGLIPVGGACDTVGLPGFLLGGGYSFVSRSYGLACDNVLSWQIVTPDCSIRTISSHSTDDFSRNLDWACRGGGGGNFGIVTEVKLQLHQPRTDRMLAGTIIFPIESAEAVMAFYDEWARSLPNEMAVYGYLGYLPHPVTDSLVPCLRLQPVFNGDHAEGMKLLEPLFAFKPLATHLYGVTLLEYIELAGKVTAIKGQHAYMRSGIMKEDAFSAGTVAIMVERLKASPSTGSFLLWMHQGGRTNERDKAATAYPHRDGSYVFEIVSVWCHEDDLRKNVEWAHATGEALGASFSGAFVNYIDPLLGNWAQCYYGENYKRLCEVKEAVDPDGLFSFQQGVGSRFEPRLTLPLDLTPLLRTHL